MHLYTAFLVLFGITSCSLFNGGKPLDTGNYARHTFKDGSIVHDFKSLNIQCEEKPVIKPYIEAEGTIGILHYVQGSGKYHEKIHEIRKLSPTAVEFDAVLFNICMSRGRGGLTEDEYQKHTNEILKIRNDYLKGKSGNKAPGNESKLDTLLYDNSGTFHLGDGDRGSNFRHWEILLGKCFKADFYVEEPMKRMIMVLETFGAEARNPVYINDKQVAVLPPQGAIKPNTWTAPRSVILQANTITKGLNILKFCSGLVEHEPNHTGDIDDFQFRNLQLKTN